MNGDDIPTEIALTWADIAYFLRRPLYAVYHWPEGAQFELIPGTGGVIVRLVKGGDAE